LFDPESVYHQEPETPYSLSIFPVAPDDWEVRCDARDADGKSYPYFDETRPLVQTVSDGQNYAKFEFVLNLFTGRVMPADTAKSTGKEVILSLTYGGAKEAKLGPDELENVKFYVRLNEVEEKALTVTQAAVTPAPFLGVTPGRKVTLSPPSGGDWVATLPTPPAATWTVRCEAFKPKDTANNPTFESGQSRTLPVDPGQSVPFEFELVLSPTRAVPK